ncbi:MAG: T9SS type A sorting domain-containing protein [Flavobacterium sp.]|nr:T9SS type A sorting domain-containing protein [Flavobacterium sp.]
MTIYDMTGRSVLTTAVIENTLNVSQLPAGQYLVKVYSDAEVLTSKLLKN